jgi:hypothetical protein
MRMASRRRTRTISPPKQPKVMPVMVPWVRRVGGPLDGVEERAGSVFEVVCAVRLVVLDVVSDSEDVKDESNEVGDVVAMGEVEDVKNADEDNDDDDDCKANPWARQ